MSFITDFSLINNAATPGDWTASGFDSPTLNDNNSPTPIYVEGSACMWWPLKKGVTDGYLYDDVTADISGRLIVAFLNYPFADLVNIPVSELWLQVSSDTGLTTSNWSAWDAKAQIYAPYNTPISGHTPIMAYPTNPDESAGTTVYTSIDSVGWRATTGETADGKQGGFDMFFAIGWIGEHSETFNGTFFDDLYEESYDSDGGGLPGTTSRPFGIISRSGDFFQTNVNIHLGHGTSDTANIDVTESGKTIFFSNVEPEHELGYVFVNPSSTHELRFSLDACVHFWTSQQSTHEIFTDPGNADYFKITNSSFTNGGKISLPADNANRWVRGTKFSSCQSGTASDGEFSDCILDSCLAMTVSGDADFTGTQVLTPNIALDTSGLAWNGNFDPDGNLDGMSFSKGATAHHAIEFGTATPTNMTLRNIAFSGFNALNAQNDSALHIKRTSGTVTINLVNCTGNIKYKSAGATVVLQSTVTVEVAGVTEGVAAKVVARETVGSVTAGDVLMEKLTDSNGEASFQHNYEGDLEVDVSVAQQGLPNAAIADDGGVQTDETTNANSSTVDDLTLLPTTPAVGDAYYFGHSEQFPRIKVDISTVAVGGTGVITWEYWNGGAWAALTGVVDGTDDWRNSGERIMSWTIPGSWAKNTVNSQGPFYFVRARMSAGSYTTAPKGRKATLDVTRYFRQDLIRTIASTGLRVVPTWIQDTISDPFI